MVCLNIDLDSCRCQQCSHISNVKHQCECCVFLLHGKRSVPGTSNKMGRKTRTEGPDTRDKRQQSSYILDVIDPFKRNSKLIPMTQNSEFSPEVWPYSNRILDLTIPISEAEYEFENI